MLTDRTVESYEKGKTVSISNEGQNEKSILSLPLTCVIHSGTHSLSTLDALPSLHSSAVYAPYSCTADEKNNIKRVMSHLKVGKSGSSNMSLCGIAA